ncbi:MAG: hypothetical protein UR66_C0003G0063 [Candidatus Moranbacteria bacterium GW2011_GWE1_35_17]|nr:MAG: hypothetical protein UR66_C0003G0063 [Candidatus Moranbacteria bacterium GW2011_GWE1_35_17]KKP81675.1 MAG: hypothetical protein UR82_C0054G0005 [Candidatus Moranbacteria bacterium GW2011_GWF1_35_5]KKP82045.1 MAG: hypothetical protein UR83_C0059G0016 [Candidatus Moranbacteria bacterium GW2011_GWF2_35_54]
MNVSELSPDGVKFKDEKGERLYRDRFVFPEVLVGVFKDNDAIVEALESSVDHEIREKRINNISDEVILKNVVGPFYEDFSVEEKRILISIIREMRSEKIKKDQIEPLGSASNRKLLSSDDLQKAVAGAKDFLKEDAVRAGFTSEVSRDSITGSLSLEGDAEELEGKIVFD